MYDIVLDTEFIVNDKGSIQLPERFNNLKVIIGEGEYNLQIGGLHSKEKSTVHISDDEYTLEEQDVTSYYPFIILNQGLFPQHLGIDFLKVYRGIVMRRLDAKSSGNKKVANSLKIVINGSFGKLGNKYSIFYAPDLLMQVTLTGQLALLMLIEALAMSGIKVVSANTDGVVIKCHKSQQHLKQQILDWWQDVTNFNLEKNEYRALYSRDVNNYIGVPVDFGIDPESKLKLKGAFAAGGLSKNPTANICTTAVTQYLTSGVPLMTTIGQCKDISNFVTVRAVKGGAVKVYGSAPKIFTRDEKEVLIRQVGYSEYYNGTWKLTDQEGLSACSFDNAFLVAHNKFKDVEKSEFLGKAVRWYYGKGETGEIVYAKSGNKVPKSDGSIPLMDMNKEIPADLDYDWYVKESESILGQLGV